MKKKLLPIIVLASVLGMSTLVGCNQGGSTPTPEPGPVEPTEVKVTGVTLNKTEVSLEVGGTETLVATVAPSDATNKKVTWSSSDESVVAVAGGVLTAKKAGRAEITVKTEDGDFTAKATVTVTEPAPVEVKVTGVTLNKSEVNLFKGGSETLVATVAPADATNKEVTWKSSDTDVVTVADGVLTAVEIGEADITVKTADGGKTAKAHVVVALDVKSITFGNTQEELAGLEEGDDFTLKLTVDPEANVNQLLASGFLTIESSNTEVASVEGLKVFANKEGTAKITASLFGKTAELDISVARRIPNKEKYGTEHEGSLEDPFTNEDALKVAKAQKEAGSYPAMKPKFAYHITGKVLDFYSSQLPGTAQDVCSWFFEPAEGQTEKFEAYKITKSGGGKWTTADIWYGDTVVIKATQFTNYNDQYETPTGELVKITPAEERPAPQVIESTVEDALTVAGALAKGKITRDSYVVEGFITEITSEWTSQYNNITFNIATEEDGKTTISAFRAIADEKLAAKLIPGAKVKITGILTKYDDKTLQFAQGCAIELVAEAEVKPLTAIDVVDSVIIAINESKTLTPKPIPASAIEEFKAGLKFESKDETVATVDKDGKITGVAGGETTIVVSVGEVKAEVSVKVEDKEGWWNTEFSPLTELDAISTDGSTYQYVIGVVSKYADGGAGAYGNLYVKSKDGQKELYVYGTYNLDGKKYGEMEESEKPVVGDVVVLYSVGSVYKEVPQLKNAIMVQKNGVKLGDPLVPTTITLPSEETVTVGDTVTIKPSSVSPKTAVLTDAEWKSSDEEVATVDDKGVVTGVKAGTAEITVKVGEVTSSVCTVTVTEGADTRWETEFPVVELDAISTDKTTYQYVIAKIASNYNDSATTYGNFNLENQDGTKTLVCYGMYDVDGNRYDALDSDIKPTIGDVVVLYSVGTTYKEVAQLSNAIIVQLNGTKICDPTEVKSISLNKETLELEEGSEYDLTVKALPKTSVLGDVEWSSSDEEVATVENGHVSAIKNGTATITATVGELTATCELTVVEAGGGSAAVTYDATLGKGDNAYDDVTVNGAAAIKVGTSSKGGSMTVTVGAGATKLYIHAAAWNGVTGLSLNISGVTASVTSIALTADSVVAGSAKEYPISNEEDYLFVIELSNVTSETVITFTSSIAKRFVVWGATYEK